MSDYEITLDDPNGDDAGKTKSMVALEMSQAFAEEFKRTGNPSALGDASVWYTRYLDALLDEAAERGRNENL